MRLRGREPAAVFQDGSWVWYDARLSKITRPEESRRNPVTSFRSVGAGITDEVERARTGGGIPGWVLGVVRRQAEQNHQTGRKQEEPGDFVPICRSRDNR